MRLLLHYISTVKIMQDFGTENSGMQLVNLLIAINSNSLLSTSKKFQRAHAGEHSLKVKLYRQEHLKHTVKERKERKEEFPYPLPFESTVILEEGKKKQILLGQVLILLNSFSSVKSQVLSVIPLLYSCSPSYSTFRNVW